ncbi:MAG TPA: thymidine phosphorylase [Polyangiaceae bacterium]|nr:thymidine phosphorylase [Polyangiaceae bacterium]
MPDRSKARPLPTSVVDWIITKRDGGQLKPEEIRRLIDGFMRGSVADYQMSAWLMATHFAGMSLEETVALTDAMLRSGRRVEHGSDSAKVDKHSTGGVGDKISLCLAPLVASCGVAVPMISGRGLGHTGGTLDKLEAIPGYATRLPIAKFKAIVRRVGVSIIGQTDDLAPADRRMYALRDVTGTVPSIPLIVASILSKKLAAGLDALVMDVKVGSGAFMRDGRHARALARALRAVGARLGLPVRALLTEMSTPIGTSIGNAIETAEAIAVLRGDGPDDTRELTLALGARMLIAARSERSVEAARRRLEQALDSGAGAERFARMIAAHGGDARVVDDPARLPRARERVPVPASRSGFVTEIEALALGELAVALGAGRTRADQAIDPRVGIELAVARGDRVERGQPLAHLHLQRRSHAPELVAAALRAFALAPERPRRRPRVIAEL